MNNLRELIGRIVYVNIGVDEEGFNISVKGKVTDVYIDDYYFEEKNEPIYIYVNIDPIEKLPEGFDDWEILNGLDISSIRNI